MISGPGSERLRFIIQLYGQRDRVSGTYVPCLRLKGFSCDSLQPVRIQDRDPFTARPDQSFQTQRTKFPDGHLSDRPSGVGQIGLRYSRHQVRGCGPALRHSQEMMRDPLPNSSEGTAGDLIHKGGDAFRTLLRNQPRNANVTLCGASECGGADHPNPGLCECLNRCSRRPGERRDNAKEIAGSDIANGILASRTGSGDVNTQEPFNDESDELRLILGQVEKAARGDVAEMTR